MANLISNENFRSLAASVEILKQPNDFLGKFLFSDEETFPTSTVDLDIVEQSRTILPYVSRRGNSTYVDKQSYKTNTVTPPYLKPAFVVTPRDVERRLAGRPLYVNDGAELSSAFEEYLSKRIYNELETLVRRTIAAQQAEVATTGALSAKDADGNELYALNYNRESALDASGVSAFSTNPLQLFGTRADLIAKFTGAKENLHVVLGSDARNAFLDHAKVGSAVDKNWSDRGRLGYTPDNSGARWLGTIDGIYYWSLPDWTTNAKTGVTSPVVGDKYALIFVQGAGAMYYGIPELLGAEPAARALKQFETNDPEGTTIQLHSAPLAVPKLVNGMGYFPVVS